MLDWLREADTLFNAEAFLRRQQFTARHWHISCRLKHSPFHYLECHSLPSTIDRSDCNPPEE